jgi:hypothetical protein
MLELKSHMVVSKHLPQLSKNSGKSGCLRVDGVEVVRYSSQYLHYIPSGSIHLEKHSKWVLHQEFEIQRIYSQRSSHFHVTKM